MKNKKISEADVTKMRLLRKRGLSPSEIGVLLGCTRHSVWRHLKPKPVQSLPAPTHTTNPVPASLIVRRAIANTIDALLKNYKEDKQVASGMLISVFLLDKSMSRYSLPIATDLLHRYGTEFSLTKLLNFVTDRKVILEYLYYYDNTTSGNIDFQAEYMLHVASEFAKQNGLVWKDLLDVLRAIG